MAMNAAPRDDASIGRMPADCDAETAKKLALADPAVQAALGGREPRKVIYVQGRLVNIVI